MQPSRSVSILVQVLVLASFATASAAFADPSNLLTVVPDGATWVIGSDGLTVPGDLVVAGVIAAAPGTGFLRIVASGDVTVTGAILGAHGSESAKGGHVIIDATGIVSVLENGHIAAGAGGHGAPVVVPGGVAEAASGGAGGTVVLKALDVIGTEQVLPGAGGRGGDAFGFVARGGAGGDAGRVLVNGASIDFTELAFHPHMPVRLADVLPAEKRSLCPPTSTGTPGIIASDGGDACADGVAGVDGIHGTEGTDDVCWTCGTKNHPPCGAYTAPTNDNLNGEKGENGYPGFPSVVGAEALGGPGGAIASTSISAGDGGAAVATGGKGGRGGNGGWGGDGAATGDGCRGGDGGNGGNGSSATAIGGLQGLNPLSCPLNGASGVGTATGGAGGQGGWGGPGGGGNWPWNNGAAGTTGSAGSQGWEVEETPQELPCFEPGAPTATAADHFFTCDTINVVIVEPAQNGNSAINSYKIFRGLTSGSLTLYATVTYSAPVQVFSDSGLTEGTPYFYSVTAVSLDGESQPSSVTSATPACPGSFNALPDFAGPVMGGGGPLIDAPVITATPGPLPGEIMLTITPPLTPGGTISHYRMFRGDLPGATVYQLDIPSSAPSPQTYIDSGLLLGATYYYNITAVTENGEGPSSNEAAAATPILMVVNTGNVRVSVTNMPFDPKEPRTKYACEQVPVEVTYTKDGYAWEFDQAIAPSRQSDVKTPQCGNVPPEQSGAYTNSYDQVRGPDRCTGTRGPDEIKYTKEGYTITAALLCGRTILESHTTTVRNLEGGDIYLEQEIVKYGAKDTWYWHMEGKLQPAESVGPLRDVR